MATNYASDTIYRHFHRTNKILNGCKVVCFKCLVPEKSKSNELCGKEITCAAKARISNLIRHLSRKHAELLITLEKKKLEKKIEEKNKKQKYTAIKGSTSQQSILKCFVPQQISLHITKDEFLEALNQLVLVEGLSFQAFDREPIQKLCGKVSSHFGFKMNRDNMRIQIIDLAKKHREQIKNKLSKMLIYLKVDSTSRHMRHYLGINAQYSNNDEIAVINLGTIDTKGKQTAEYTKKIIEKCLDKFGINKINILGLSVDNAAVNIKLVRDFGISAVEDIGDDEDDFSVETDEFDEDGYSKADNAEAVLASGVASSMSVIHLQRCAVHTLQLAVNDALKRPTIKNLINHARDVVKAARNSKWIDFFRDQTPHLIPILDQATRWSSQFNMIERLIKIRPVIQNLNMQKEAPKEFNVRPCFWGMWEELRDVLHMARDLTIRLQRENITAGEFLFDWNSIKCELDGKDSDLAKDFQKGMDNRESALRENPLFLAAVYVDIRHGCMLTATEDKITAADGLWKIHYKLIQLANENKNNELNKTKKAVERNSFAVYVSDSSSENEENASPVAKRRPNLFKLCEQEVQENSSEEQMQVQLDVIEKEFRLALKTIPEIRSMFKEKSSNLDEFLKLNPLKSIEQFPEVVRDACRVALSLPISQVSVERLFSVLKHMTPDHRSRFTSDLIDDMLFLRTNEFFI
ncbi:uncharacterized protein LOC124811526 isoform X1 [Hydra vulgaris]|uniref:uncharacterized protein LOC124808044 n=1 Tax=Hydra vulgaris TaxID=6087 RepID=UPI001F5F7209|nr:uncharacterized protein LOC124807731 [Hydra vulgaris]XP_047127036.1 uncharacterized protein LOC124808044 [Hydra vulgaris]XP_047128530.1 uncharacterized protein LOC105849822 [Hydra vulgaris]XP_047128969.1 uncharacterized protein LOC124809190 [Hydra vulgaris]XP_047133265.1 uncharacterized protein LOC124811526 [Hydra vulgaris]